MTEQICKNCKHWEFEFRLELGVGCCTNDQKYKDISFGMVDNLDMEFNAGTLGDDWFCSIETDEDDHCKYWEATDDD
jgi:hypothetical protein